MTCTSYGTHKVSSTSLANVSLQVDVELEGTEGVVLDAVCSFALKNNARGLTAETFYL